MRPIEFNTGSQSIDLSREANNAARAIDDIVLRDTGQRLSMEATMRVIAMVQIAVDLSDAEKRFALAKETYGSLEFSKGEGTSFDSWMDVLSQAYDDAFRGRPPKLAESSWKTYYDADCTPWEAIEEDLQHADA